MYIPQDYETYQDEWDKVESLIKKGLPKSALEIVESIYSKAKNENNHPQFIKATLYKIKLKADFEEEFIENIISDLNSEIKQAGTPVKQILHSIEADIYRRYYQANRYKFMERTTTGNFDNNDIRTWDLKHLLGAIINNYTASIKDEDELKRTNLKVYDVILETTETSKKYRPTLYDFLANRAVDFFMNDESSIIQPVYKFVLDKEVYFSDASKFARLDIETRDSLSLKFYATQILQNLIGFHLNDKDPTALVDIDLKRLEFVRLNSILPAKDSLFLNSVQQTENKYKSYPVSADAGYIIASELLKNGQKYSPLVSDLNKWDVKESYEKCEEVIKRFPDSDGAQNCKVLKAGIVKSNIKITKGNVNIPEKPFLTLVDYKNVSKIYFRIVQTDFEADRDLQQSYRRKNDLLEQYISKPVFRSWEQEIPDDGDYQNHSVEVKIPGLPLGYYIVLASTTDDFSLNAGMIAYGSVWISKISYISQKSAKNGFRFYVLDRESGSPVKGVSAKIFFREYDYNSREYIYKQGGSFVSDSKGYFEIPALEENTRPNSFFIDFANKDDRLVTENQFYQAGYHPPTDRKETRTWFFTDRSIYRPGQTVYFKGIVLEGQKEEYDIKPGFKTTVEFKDANYQKIAELELTTNKYGSFNGSFIAPAGVLNGQMTIKNNSGSVTISVEEYKRPKFEVVFNPVEGSYKLNEQVNVTGSAKAYAGSNIDNAQVKYRVVRNTDFPWRYGWFGYFPASPEMEIAEGITTTDENGEFKIDFKAIPDYSASAKYHPDFRYTVYADVTDINGETQSATTSVVVSKTALKVNLDIADMVDKENFNEFKITTTNLNGRPEPAQGKIIISKLQQPERLLRDRLWNTPDKFVIGEEEFVKNFPYDEYKNESDFENLKAESVVATLDFNTASDSIVKPDNIANWNTGQYSIRVETTDSFGEAVELTEYFTLFSQSDKNPPVSEINWFYTLKDKCEPGENAAFIIGTKDKNINALYEVVCKDKVVSSQWLKLNDEQRKIEIPVTEEYRGGLSVNVIFVKHNRSFRNSFNIDVPFTNKKLEFEFATFRNKLTPGQKEEWKIIIKGAKGDSVAAELLASMYDASLDALKSHKWLFDLYRSSYGSLTWQGQLAFSAKNLYTFQPQDNERLTPVFREYDRLNWFGFNYYGGGPYYRKGLVEGGEMMDRQAMPGQMNMEKADGEEPVYDEAEELGGAVIGEEISGQPEKEFSGLQIRRDFRETAFFFPSLQTNEKGEAIISFTVPESLTRWKLMGLAHTTDLKYGQFEKDIISQKDLMIVPNAPRFFREGDKISFSAKVVNLSERELSGEATVKFFDARTMKDISALLNPEIAARQFNVSKGNSQQVEWEITIPHSVDVIVYRIAAKSGNFSDGEEKAIPVLTNRMLVTESLPLPVKGNETKSFKFDKLIKSKKGNKTLKNFKFTLEFSSNPAWYAVQALPYIMETDIESADNIFNRYYANSIASFLVNSNPKIKQVFDTWKNYSPDALLSNLEKNEELKSLILSETPWVLDAENETERKQRVALLFDLNRMSDELTGSLRKLKQKQSPNGGWPWFKGMRESRNITQNIVTGFGHLKQLGVYNIMDDADNRQMITRAIRYLDQRMKEDYEKIKERNSDDMNTNHLSMIQIQYLYARSYFMKDMAVSKTNMEAFGYFRDQSQMFWLDFDKQLQGMIALALNRLGVKSKPTEIMTSIKEHALYSDEMGMYWRDNQGGYYWYQAPVETQAILIEAFDEITFDKEAVEQMKIWLLKQKQTQDWKTSKATAEAVYALMLRGADWLAYDKIAEIKVGNEVIDPFARDDTKVEAGTGYFKTSWAGSDVNPGMGEITVTNENEGIAWGAVYWQYFENLDKITKHETPLKLDKKLFVERNTGAGPVIEPVEDGTVLKVGDKIKVRIELRVDRDMEYVHMKDMRASAFEPVNVLSGYKYGGGLGYYESTKDASTDFFFDYLRKGTYVFEYPLVVSQKGDFSNGITTIQCMYAPEFTSHSEGVRVEVE